MARACSASGDIPLVGALTGVSGELRLRTHAVRIELALLALLTLASIASAQTVNGAIIGVVKDTSGAVVPDVALTLRNMATDLPVATTMSGAEGAFAFRNVTPSKYQIEALKLGFQQV